jgi:hypothetical protein
LVLDERDPIGAITLYTWAAAAAAAYQLRPSSLLAVFRSFAERRSSLRVDSRSSLFGGFRLFLQRLLSSSDS